MSFHLKELPYKRCAMDAVLRIFDGQQWSYFFRLDWTHERRDDFPSNRVCCITDSKREALVFLALERTSPRIAPETPPQSRQKRRCVVLHMSRTFLRHDRQVEIGTPFGKTLGGIPIRNLS